MRSEDIERYLRNANYPADKRDLMDYARRQNAPDDVVRALDMLPEQRFNSAMDVSKSMSGGSRGMGSSSMGSRSKGSR
ncbi:MAG: DUF2795 domain-containing protein [Methanotrichaceae archaeon]|nr:DUF2795 domain-containing protein [Methanotrichaceae archaeon]